MYSTQGVENDASARTLSLPSASCDMTTNVDRFMSFPWITCANLHRNRFIRFRKKNYHMYNVGDRRTDGQTDRRTNRRTTRKHNVSACQSSLAEAYKVGAWPKFGVLCPQPHPWTLLFLPMIINVSALFNRTWWWWWWWWWWTVPNRLNLFITQRIVKLHIQYVVKCRCCVSLYFLLLSDFMSKKLTCCWIIYTSIVACQRLVKCIDIHRCLLYIISFAHNAASKK